MISAFGIDHGDFNLFKADQKPSPKRTALTAAFPGTHGAIAGKKGRKSRAAVNESVPAWVGGLAGGAIGAVPGALVRSPKLAAIGGTTGVIAGRTGGALSGMKRNHDMKHYDRESKHTLKGIRNHEVSF